MYSVCGSFFILISLVLSCLRIVYTIVDFWKDKSVCYWLIAQLTVTFWSGIPLTKCWLLHLFSCIHYNDKTCVFLVKINCFIQHPFQLVCRNVGQYFLACYTVITMFMLVDGFECIFIHILSNWYLVIFFVRNVARCVFIVSTILRKISRFESFKIYIKCVANPVN